MTTMKLEYQFTNRKEQTMCGIYGSIGNSIDQSVIRGLMVANESRGKDSTGVAVKTSSGIEIIKKAVAASEFERELSVDFLDGAEAVIGHTRLATYGDVNDENSHPFRDGSVVGVHNGQINNHRRLGKFKVDSQAIFHIINVDGVEGLNRISGSAAIAWLEDGSDNLFLVSHTNPLAMAVVGDTMYFSSEAVALFSVLVASGLGYDELAEAEQDMLYTINPSLEVIQTEVEFNPFYVAKKNYSKQSNDGYDHDWLRQNKSRIWQQEDEPVCSLDEAETTMDQQHYEDVVDMFYEASRIEGCVMCSATTTSGWLDEQDLSVYCDKCVKRHKIVTIHMTYVS